MLNNYVTITIDATEASAIIKHLIDSDRFVEAQWVDGLDANGKEYGKYVTEDVVGFWSDNFRFGDDLELSVYEKRAAFEWVISNIPSQGDVRIVYV